MREKTKNASVSRRMELLSHYYRIDEEKKIVYLDVHVDKATDLLENGFGKGESLAFSNAMLEKIADIYEKIPLEYRVEIDFRVGDYEGYDPTDLLTRFNEALELNNYLIQKSKRKKWLQAVILMLAGLAILVLMGFGTMHHWFGEGEAASICNEVLDIAGWVFIWEAVTVLFLEPNRLGVLGLRILSRTSEIVFYGADGARMVFEEGKAIVSKWEDEGKVKKAGRISLLLSSAAFIAMAFGSLFLAITSFDVAKTDPVMLASMIVSTVFIVLFNFLSGAAGISKYVGRGKLGKWSLPFAVIIAIELVFYVIISIIYASWDFTAPMIFTFISEIAYIFGVLTNMERKAKAK